MKVFFNVDNYVAKNNKPFSYQQASKIGQENWGLSSGENKEIKTKV
jgi:hypothetical protein